LPVTLRNVEAALPARDLPVAPSTGAAGSKVSDLQPTSDTQIIAWYRKLQRYDAFRVPRTQAARDVSGALPPPLDAQDREDVQTRMVSLLRGQPGVQTLDLPRPAQGDPRPFEVVGIPLSPGFHVVEIASPMLGASLLDPRHARDRTMYVRTSALVTNLGVHFKLGRENALAWVTALDSGRPVPLARVKVSDCQGREVASGVTDASGIARFSGIAPQAPDCVDAVPAPISTCLVRKAWPKTWHSPGATGTRASSRGASSCPPAGRTRRTPAPTRSSIARLCARGKPCR
jgi:alpha-2-macroglobulin